MKIFYAVQATGNGHISRAMELLPYLQQYGPVDIFLSGNNSHLVLDAPVKYRSKGVSLYYNCKGGLDFWKLIRKTQLLRLKQESNDLPVENYDLVINDFDYITSAACAKKNIPSVNLGHQASFKSPLAPRPVVKSFTGEWILKNYARATRYIGFHFQAYDDFICTPVIKKEVLEAIPFDGNYVTVYLPSYCEPQLIDIFHSFSDIRFEIFCSQTQRAKSYKNISLLPVDRHLFTKSLVGCSGIITGGGFETPAEALHLGKKIMAIPISNHYEQQCNAAALEQLGVTTLKKIDRDFADKFYTWLYKNKSIKMDYSQTIPQCLAFLFSAKTAKTFDQSPSKVFV